MRYAFEINANAIINFDSPSSLIYSYCPRSLYGNVVRKTFLAVHCIQSTCYLRYVINIICCSPLRLLQHFIHK